MCILNFSRGFIFVHVPKSAGTSVTSVLSQFSTFKDLEIGGTALGEAVQPFFRRRYGLYKHVPARELRMILEPGDWNGLLKFAFVRNPYARCVSTYNFLKSWRGIPERYGRELQKIPTFESFVLSDLWSDSEGPDKILRPQWSWLSGDSPSEGAIVDEIGRVEHLAEDMARILRRIGLSDDELPGEMPRQNVSVPADCPIWSDAVVERVRERYTLDFEHLGYSMELPEAVVDS